MEWRWRFLGWDNFWSALSPYNNIYLVWGINYPIEENQWKQLSHEHIDPAMGSGLVSWFRRKLSSCWKTKSWFRDDSTSSWDMDVVLCCFASVITRLCRSIAGTILGNTTHLAFSLISQRTDLCNSYDPTLVLIPLWDRGWLLDFGEEFSFCWTTKSWFRIDLTSSWDMDVVLCCLGSAITHTFADRLKEQS